MNPTKQQLEDELTEVEISIDLYIKEIENLESTMSPQRTQCGLTPAERS